MAEDQDFFVDASETMWSTVSIKTNVLAKKEETMDYVAIDPMAVILPEKIYLIWVEIHHPNTPLVDDLSKLFKRMTAADKKVVLGRAKAVGAISQAVEKAAPAR